MVTEEAYATVVAENAQLKAQNAALQADLAAALQRIAVLEAQKRPPPAFVKANAPARAPKERKKRAPEHNRARRLEPPTRVVEHRIERCPACQGRLSALTVARRRQVVDLLPPPPVEVSEHQVYQGWCSYCRTWRAAPLDLRGQVLGQGRLGVGIASLVAHLRTALRLPIRQIRAYLADLHGLQVSVGEVVELLHRVAQQGSTAVAHLLEQVRASAVVLGDETVWRENGRHGYIWLLAIPGGARYFAYRQSRAGAVVNELLGEAFTGVLSSDFYAGYNDTPGGGHQRCWVHLLRDLHALKEGHADQPEVVTWATAVKALYERAKPLAQGPPLPAAVRHEQYEELVAAAVALGARFAQAKGHPCHALAQRLLRHQGELFTFVRVAGVPADNNEAERILRPLVVGRKISGGSRSSRGSATRMALSSLVATWLTQGLNPLDACRRLLQTPLPQL
jgi:transposase